MMSIILKLFQSITPSSPEPPSAHDIDLFVLWMNDITDESAKWGEIQLYERPRSPSRTLGE